MIAAAFVFLKELWLVDHFILHSFLKRLAKKKGEVLFANQAVNVKKNLSNVISTIMAGIPVIYTNHSARKTAPTRMYQGKIEEQTQHRSLVFRMYKESSEEQLQEKSNVIYVVSNERYRCIDVTGNTNSKMTIEIDGEQKRKKIVFL